jgi:restriction system protein
MHRANVAAQRRAEHARRASERAQAAAARTSAAEAREAEREMARLHAESRTAEAEVANAMLASMYAEIDGLLAATLEVDDWVDLECLRIAVEHPPFNPGDVGRPIPAPAPPQYPPVPVLQEPPEPAGLAGILGGRKRHEAALKKAREDYAQACRVAQGHADALHRAHQQQVAHHATAEKERLEALATARTCYEQECAEREADVAEHNAALDQLINELAFDVPSAIEEYVGIVLSNSVYPESFPVAHEYQFDLTTRELALMVRIPAPSELPVVKQYRWVKASDEITASTLPVREQKERYSGAVAQVAVRSLHEVFEADRAGRIHSIALTVSTDHLNEATGQPETVPLVVVAADRKTFSGFDLANVVPSATLAHLGAAVSAKPADLVPAPIRGVRASRAAR